MNKNAFKNLSILFFFLSYFLTAQEVLLEFDTDYEVGPAAIDNSFTLINEKNNEFTVFLTNKSDLSAFNFDDSLKFKGWLASKQLLNKYKLPLGGTVHNKKYTLFYSNNNKNKFAAITFDFESNWSEATEIDLNLKNEIYLSQFVYKNKFHFLTTNYRESLLFIYSLDNSGNYVKNVIDFSQYEIYGRSNTPTRLKSTLGLDVHYEKLTNVVAVQQGIPYSLDSMVSLIKLYLIENSIHLVSDINQDFTQILSYNLINGETSVDIVQQGNVELGLSNSYLTDKHLFQIAVNSKKMVLNITDLNTKESLKQHTVFKKDSLYLANGPIRQRGGRYKKYRELEKTSQFLRKLNNGNPAIFVNEINDQFEINIGSVDEITDDLFLALSYMNPFTAIATFGALTLYVNPVALAMIKSSNSKAVYINNVLNASFETTNKEEKDNIFYIINDFIKEEDLKRYSASDVFKYKDFYLFGMLDKKSKKYILRKFEH